ncbi:MAG: ABC-F type ribosomal protection protein [Clostridiales bacterium]|uniref:ribosomal protection-like ABC-F family protein n=1 Tax=Clostridium sp. N3C TaxID=1776758 RepID=UPI00092DEABB|nr:ABC-F type ribosomal protection protein [Clostridium sp. N3C]NLZ49733.1 ABC-F type ribosomal protection protein [Clostridiales bacterium]SCN25257.1 putative ABC transporter ATP-binding protein YheS [Clostridium sp. N3C]
MLLAEICGVKKYFGDRLILSVDNFKIYSGDRIGVVGLNGAGKSTFLNILAGRILPEEGKVEIKASYSYITQLEDEEPISAEGALARRFGVKHLSAEGNSGGEKTRKKLAASLERNTALIMADEPTSNLDREGIELLQKEFKEFEGALLIVSHDREFLDEVCNSILEIEDGKIKIYKGNYSKYKMLKEQERERAYFEYEEYTKEKQRLEAVILETKEKVKTMRKAPPRMGNSEARLHKMGNQKAKASLDRAVKNIKARIDKMEVKEKPKELPRVNMDLISKNKLHCKVVIRGEKITKSFGKRVIFEKSEFKIINGSKTALIGPNGCGKTTLINMMVSGHDSIKVAKGVKIGYFTQNLNMLDLNKSLLENVMESSIQNETFVRTLLARLLFNREDLNKKVELLSGGERVKGALAKIMVSDFNMLILDEPTNYLDIYSLEAVEEALKEYNNTILFVSHDRKFVKNLADHILEIENRKINFFQGSLEEYLKKKQQAEKPQKEEIDEAELMLLQNRMAEILGRLSMPSKKDDVEALDLEYKEILEKLKRFK